MKIYTPIVVLAVLLLSLNTQAEGQEKKFNIGIGTYALKIAYDNSLVGNDDELAGLGISASYAFTDHFAIRGEYYSLEHNDDSNLDVTGIDLVA